jgi:hypothetical protein
MRKEYHGILSIENGNLMYDKRIFDNVKKVNCKTIGLLNTIKINQCWDIFWF